MIFSRKKPAAGSGSAAAVREAAAAAPPPEVSGRAAVLEELTRPQDSISIIKLVDALIRHAYESRASDIHFDPEADRLRARLRIDGVLYDAFLLPKDIHPEIVSRLKVLSGLRTDEHAAAQDGRFKTEIENAGSVDIRISIVPTYYGENAVLRILAEQGQDITLENIGFSGSDLERVGRAVKKPYGMVLATGPTGSGKTTSLYAIIRILNKPEISIITIEDPIEYSLVGVNQIQVSEQTGLTFAKGLRSILRQDPNVIMVGEIRDEETARIAVNAALTGHLLLSTLHTNDAATTLPRLLDMGVEPFLIASTVNIAIGQRLVRTICPACKVERPLSEAESKSLSQFLKPRLLQDGVKFYQGKGCGVCGGSGYRGRIGIHEVLEINDEIRELLMRQANASEIKAAAVKNGMTTMLEDGFLKAKAGITTIEEILRVTHE